MKNRSQPNERSQAGFTPGRETGAWQDLPEAMKYGDMCYQAERYADALEAYLAALESAPRGLAVDLRARLHYRISGCYMERANYRLALDHLDQARKVLPRHLDKVRLAKIYARRGRIMQETGQYDRALRYLSWAQKILRNTDEHEELALIENRLGTVHVRLGRSNEARDCFLNALATYRRIENRSGEASALNNLALHYKNQCEYREAVRYLEQARLLCERIGFRQRLVSIHLNLGIIHFKLGKWELCEENLAAAQRLAEELGARQSLVRVQIAQGNLELRRRNWTEAEHLFSEARSAAEAEGYARERILAEEFRGELFLEQGRLDRAESTLEFCLTQAREMAPLGDLVYEILRRLGELRLRQEDYAEALILSQEAAAGASRIGDRYEEAAALRGVALAMLHLGRREEGERLMLMSLDSLGYIGESFQKGLTHLEFGRYLAEAARSSREVQDLERAVLQLQRAYGAFLDLDARGRAAEAAYERAVLEYHFQHFDEAATYRAKARQVLHPGSDPDLEHRLDTLGEGLEDAFAERWSTGGDMLASLREMKRLFQGAADTEAVLRQLIRLGTLRSRSDRGCVATPVDGGGFHVAAVFGWEHEQASGLLRDLGPQLDDALRENRPVWSAHAGEDPRFAVLAAEPHRTRSLVLLPFTLGEGEPGFLYVDKTEENSEPSYHQGELHLLTILANLAALSVVERRNLSLARENEALKRRIADEEGPRMVTANAGLIETLRMVAKVGESAVSILIEGETGTGKGLLAQIIHTSSNRRERPLVQVNCAALPEHLLESELFGHVKGSFTGATYNKVGLFKEADGGTIFLDEVDKMSLPVQAKLLQVLDTREVRPVGAVKSMKVETRVICATNADLRERIKNREFLEDLYYRLNDFIVKVPPLRERREDIPLLLDHFLRKFADQYGRPGVKLSPEVHRILLDLSWPGNVRELEKTVRRLVVLADEDAPIGVDLLPPEIQVEETPMRGSTLREEISRTERRVIAEALKSANWNKSEVSRQLKISYPSLLKKIKEHGLVRAS